MDADLQQMSVDEVRAEAQRLRDGIRRHRDARGHDLCWWHPELWSLLPEPGPKVPEDLPPTAEFLHACRQYRRSCEPQGQDPEPFI